MPGCFGKPSKGGVGLCDSATPSSSPRRQPAWPRAGLTRRLAGRIRLRQDTIYQGSSEPFSPLMDRREPGNSRCPESKPLGVAAKAMARAHALVAAMRARLRHEVRVLADDCAMKRRMGILKICRKGTDHKTTHSSICVTGTLVRLVPPLSASVAQVHSAASRPADCRASFCRRVSAGPGSGPPHHRISSCSVAHQARIRAAQ